MPLLFVIGGPRKANAGNSNRFLFCLHSRGHSRPSNSPAHWRRGVLLLPMRGPPDFRFPPKKPASPKFQVFRLLQKNADLRLGSRCYLRPSALPESRAEKGDLKIMYQNRISLIGFVGN